MKGKRMESKHEMMGTKSQLPKGNKSWKRNSTRGQCCVNRRPTTTDPNGVCGRLVRLKRKESV